MKDINTEKDFRYKTWEEAAKKKETQEAVEVLRMEAPVLEESEEEVSAPKSTADLMEPRHNYLEAIRLGLTWEDAEEEREAYFSSFMLSHMEPSAKERELLTGLQTIAGNFLLSKDESQGRTKINSQLCVKMSKDQMKAWLFAFPPANGGKELTEELIEAALEQCGIVYGIDEVEIGRVVRGKNYLKLFPVACGTDAVAGKAGRVKDLYPRLEKPFIEDWADQEIDEDRVDWLHRVEAGTVICEIIPRIETVDGMNIRGEVVRGPRIMSLAIPAGSNTELVEHGTKLIAGIKGTLYFEEGKFHVKNVLNILTDVDLSVGNVDTLGNLEIKGDVFGGFSVRATGNIHIHGMVGNSSIIAGGSITIGMGARGCGEALLDARGDINCRYIENCTVRARGNVKSGSIINCEIVTEGSIESETIVGGSISALRKIHARVIGNTQRRPILFSIGNTQEVRQEKINLEGRVRELDVYMGQMIKNIRFLKNKREQTDGDKAKYRELVEEYDGMEKEKEESLARLKEINDGIGAYAECELTANRIYPPAAVSILSDVLVIDREQNMCRIWLNNGEIQMS